MYKLFTITWPTNDMIFEDFFAKKKINLAQLSLQNPALHTFLRQEYDALGPKNFDHVKKYHFNKLRHQYPLQAASPLATPGATYVPRFGNTPTAHS